MLENVTNGTEITTKLPRDLDLAKWATHRALNDFHYFLSWVKTKDEAAGIDKLLYPAELEYTKVLAEKIQNAKKPKWIPKSRRLMLTWTMCAYILWKMMGTPAFHGFVQTNKEDDADFLVKHRIKYIWDNLPHWMKYVAMGGQPEANYVFLKFTLPNGAQAWGIPKGTDVLRQYTPTLLFIDEAAKQEQFEDTLAAVQPFYEKNFQAFYVSSVKPTVVSEFSRVVYTTRPKSEITMPMKGMREWTLERGGEVLEVHYSADPHKDPEREGRGWYERQDEEWVGGVEGPQFQTEMEIKPDAQSGTLRYTDYVDEISERGTVVEPFDPSLFEEAWRVIDWGNRNETCCLWLGLLDDTYYIYREFYEKGVRIEDFKSRLSMYSGLPGEPRYSITLIDPAADRENYKGMLTTFFLLNTGENKLGAIKAKNADDGEVLVQTWLHQGRLKVFKDCTNARWEFTKYRWADWTPATQKDHNLKETTVDKFNHAMDCIKYFGNFRTPWENKRAQIITQSTYDRDIQKVLDEMGASNRRYYSSGVMHNA